MVLREFLLFLSRQKQLRSWMETSSLSRKLTRRFVAGQSLDEALNVARQLNQEGIMVTLDCLGENVTSLAEAEGSRDTYLQALCGLSDNKINSSVSIKLTQFGMDISEEACRRNVVALTERAKALEKWVEVDMESQEYVDRTLSLVQYLHGKYGNVRAVVQAYLRRTASDVERLCEIGIPVRLCKGAYSEPADVAFVQKAEVDANYVRLMKVLLQRGNYPGLATHDEKIVDEATRFVKERNIGAERFEFQMLYGIRRDLQRRLGGQGFRLRLYVPYGVAWYPYFMRRLAERPANVLFLAKNLLRA